MVIEAISSHRTEVRTAIGNRLQTLTMKALDRAGNLLADPETPPSVIVRLMGLLLAEHRLYVETTELAERLDRMEHHLTYKENPPDEI